MDQKPATTIAVGGRTFIVRTYSASQALELLLALGEVAAPALGGLLGREVSPDLSSLAEAADELRDSEVAFSSLLSLFGTLRKTGGVDLVVQILRTTWVEDRPIDSRKRFDEVFVGPAGLGDAVRLVWEVLVYQLGPLFDDARPLLSGLAARKKTTPES